MSRSRFASWSSRAVARRSAQACALAAAILLGTGLSAAHHPPEAPPLPPEVAHALSLIRGEEIVRHARVLSDPENRGRRSGSGGVRQAALYVAERLREAGFQPAGPAGSHFQVFKIRPGYKVTGKLKVTGEQDAPIAFACGEDYMPLHLPGGKAELSAECAFAGYGIVAPALKFDEYSDLDVKGKAVLAFSGAPWSRKASAWIRRAAGGEDYEGVAHKARAAAERGAVCLLIVDNPAGWREDLALVERLKTPDADFDLDSPLPALHVTRNFAAKLSGLSLEEMRLTATEIAASRASRSMLLRGRRLDLSAELSGQATLGRNVVAVLPGRDDALRREAVVVGAHYDHLGEGAEGVYFGANDNAAGVGALLALASAFGRLAAPPRRTLVLIAFDAEEIGRMGSKHYVAHPRIGLDKTALMINFDMIGRNDPDHVNVVGTRSSPELHEIHQELNRRVGLKLTHPMWLRIGRSDHSPFYLAGVPVMYLFGGLDEDYSTPRDTWDKLIPAKTEKVARLAFLTAWEVAERRARITFEERPEEELYFSPE